MKHRVKMKLTKKFTLFSCLPLLFSCSYRMGTPPRQIYSDELKNILLTKREFVKDIPYLIGKNDSNSDDFALLSNEEMTISFSCSAFESVYNKQLGTCVSRAKTYDKTSYKCTYEESVTDQLEIGLTYEEFSKFVTNKFGFSIIFSCNDFLPFIEDMFLEEETWTLYEDGKPQFISKSYSKNEFDEDEAFQAKIKDIFQDKYNYDVWYQKTFPYYKEEVSFSLGVTRKLDDILPDVGFGEIYFRYASEL